MKVLTAQSNKNITALTIKFVHYHQSHKIKHIYTLVNENHQHLSRSETIQLSYQSRWVYANIFFVYSEIK